MSHKVTRRAFCKNGAGCREADAAGRTDDERDAILQPAAHASFCRI